MATAYRIPFHYCPHWYYHLWSQVEPGGVKYCVMCGTMRKVSEPVDDISDTDKALDYYKTCFHQPRTGKMNKPRFVPSRVRVASMIWSAFQLSVDIQPGDYDCESNQYGAVSVRATDGSQLGLRPDEFEPLEWRVN